MNIKCISCKYTRKDLTQHEKIKGEDWYGIECSNPDSEFYKSLLNVTPGGTPLKRVSWSGCRYGERRAR